MKSDSTKFLEIRGIKYSLCVSVCVRACVRVCVCMCVCGKGMGEANAPH